MAMAQSRGTDANIHGHVIHAQTREHIPFVTITIKGTTIGVVADASGHFFLKNLPVGEHTIVAESIGLKSVEQSVTMQTGKSIEVNFMMEDQTETMDEVVVSATRNETNKKSTATIVNVASAKLFESTASTNLAESMAFQPGLRVENTCGNCGAQEVKTMQIEAGKKFKDLPLGRCPNCQSSLILEKEEDIIDELTALADMSNTRVEIISDDFEEGGMLMSAFGGIAAVLRYPTGL